MSKFEITQVEGILILGNDGERIATKYYKLHGVNQYNQRILEKSLLDQLEHVKDTGDSKGCMIVEGHTIVYHVSNDVYLIIVSKLNENAFLLAQVCDTLHECLLNITHDNITKQGVHDKLASTFLLLDDLVDGGIIMEVDSNVIMKRLKRKESTSGDTLHFNQTIYNVRNNVIRTLLNS